MSAFAPKQRFVTLLLLAVLLLHALTWLQDNAGAFWRVYQSLGQTALWRSANFSQSQKFADYIVFLDENISTDLRVILPPQDAGPKILSTTPVMQFYLLPRQVINCDTEECVLKLDLKHSAVLLVGDFPGEQIETLVAKKLMFNERWGVLLPDSPATNPKAERTPRLASLLWAMLLPMAWIGMITLTGWGWLRVLLPASSNIIRLALGYGLGLSSLTLSLAGLSILGVRPGWQVVFAVSCVLFISALVMNIPMLRRNVSHTRLPPVHFSTIDPWLVIILVLGFLALFLGVGRGYSASDELLLWGPKGYGIAADRSVEGVMGWGTNTVYYPLHIPLLVAAFNWMFQESLPASKLVFAAYFVATLVIVYDTLIRKKIPRPQAGLLSVCLGMTPLIFRHATLAYANLPLAFMLLAAVVVFDDADHPNRTSRTLVAGMFLAAAAWTRPEGFVMGWFSAALFLVVVYQREWKFPDWRQTGVLLGTMLGYTVFWQAVQAVAYIQPAAKSELVDSAIEQILAGNLHLGDAWYVFQAMLTGLFEYQTWGMLGILLLVLLVSTAFNRFKSARRAGLFMVAGCFFVGLLLGTYYLVSYDPVHDIQWWVNTGLERMSLPSVLMLFLGAVITSQLFYNAEDRTAATNT